MTAATEKEQSVELLTVAELMALTSMLRWMSKYLMMVERTGKRQLQQMYWLRKSHMTVDIEKEPQVELLIALV